MPKVYLGLGSNLGNKEDNLCNAIQQIESRIGKIVSRSGFYETPPWGFVSDNAFLNAVVCVESNLLPLQLLNITQQIEKEMGRTLKSAGTYADRLIDIDILLYGHFVYESTVLTIPHPLMTQRKFVMEPLREVAPDIAQGLIK